MRVLIVDDHAANRQLPAAILRKLGCEIAEAESGEAALAHLALHDVDCVLLDISMPGLSGEEVCERIRADPRLQRLKVIAYTAHAMQSDEARIMRAGFDHLLVKPISRAALLAAVGLG